MAACMKLRTRLRMFDDLATYSRINVARTIIKREKADVPKPKFNKDKQGHKMGVCIVPFPRVLDIDPVVDEACENPLRDLKYHPGIMTSKLQQLPELLTINARTLLARKSWLNQKELNVSISKLNNVIKCRQPPMEKKDKDRDLQQIFEKNYSDLLEKGIDPEQLEEKARQKLEKKSLKSFHKTNHAWKKFKFDEKVSLIYMAARLAPNYRILHQIFHEIHKRDNGFIPTSIYNFGSGLGTVVWAADGIWGNKVFEYYNVDESPSMNDMARELLAKDLDDSIASSIKGVHFRQFPLSDHANVGAFPMVVSAFTLMDQPSRVNRLGLIDSLWKLTEKYLVLVEHGTVAGHRLITEARDFILKQQKEGNPDTTCHIFAPCTHDKVCPKLQLHKVPCTFTTEYKPLNVGKEYGQGAKSQTDLYTYVVIKKGERAEDETHYPRILDIKKKQGFSECQLCCRDGTLRNYAISKVKPSKMVHIAVRKSECGDFLPVRWPSDAELKILEIDPDPPVEKAVLNENLGKAEEAMNSEEKSVETENSEDENVDEHSEILGFRLLNVDDEEVIDDNFPDEYSNVDFDIQETGELELKDVTENLKTFDELLERIDLKKSGKS